MAQSIVVHWAIEMLRGAPLPNWTPPKTEVVGALMNLEQSLERKTSRKGKVNENRIA